MKQGEIYLVKCEYDYLTTPILIYTRVICFDNIEVLFDEKSIEDEDWIINNKKLKTMLFSRTTKKFLTNQQKLVDFKPLEDWQIDLLKPYLPIRFGRFRDVSWGDEFLNEEKTIIEFLRANNCDNEQIILNVNQIYLKGINKNEFPGKPILIEAKNKINFQLSEILSIANKIMMSIKSNKNFKSNGIGIYRSGIKSRIPTYYIWGFYDLANFLAKYELEGNDISNV